MINSLDEALKRTTKVDRYNQWIYEMIEKELGNRIMEIGCGIGNLTRFFLNKEFVLATDTEQSYLEEILQNMKGDGKVLVSKYDVGADDPLPFKKFQIDTIVCLNVLEHIKDDEKALYNMFQILCDGGTLILLVPALQLLYGSLDRFLCHQRRYSKKTLLAKLRKVGFKVRREMYMNVIGIFGWFINSRILHKEIVPKRQLYFYNQLVHFLKFIERIFHPPVGLSYLCFCTKPCIKGS